MIKQLLTEKNQNIQPEEPPLAVESQPKRVMTARRFTSPAI